MAKVNTKSRSAQGTRKTVEKSGKGSGKTKVARMRTNNFIRLSDVEKIVGGRCGGACYDETWHERYFFAALPYIIATRAKYRIGVLAWVRAWTPLLYITRGAEWIGAEADRCAAKVRKFPRIDRLARLLGVEDHEPDAFGLCALSAVSRPKAVRDAEDGERRRRSAQKRRAAKPGHRPRSQSYAAKARAAGIKPGTDRVRRYRERKTQDRAHQHVAETNTVEARDVTVSCPTDRLAGCNGFVPHISRQLEAAFLTSKKKHNTFVAIVPEAQPVAPHAESG